MRLMKIEMAILDWIQSIRTPIGDILIPLITKLGDTGAIWSRRNLDGKMEIMEACFGDCGVNSVFEAVFICALSYRYFRRYDNWNCSRIYRYMAYWPAGKEGKK